MPEILLNGRPVRVPAEVTLLAALHAAGYGSTRVSLSGERRGALCGMGICYECRVRVNGTTQRSCLTPVQDGMRVEEVPNGL